MTDYFSEEKPDYRIVVLGTSISWGEGLKPEEKFSSLVADSLVASGQCQRPGISCYARSGAQLWNPKGEYPTSLASAHVEVAKLRKAGAFVAAEKNRADGECPRGHPYGWTQLMKAQADLIRAKAEADLVLIDFGANDVGIMHVTERNWTASQMKAHIDALEGRLEPFFRAVREAEKFQKAQIVVCGYYEAFTMGSQAGGKVTPCARRTC